ncbi:MAG: hypothetical protein JWO40_240 [Candidatus Doudnabacteria bacterium]|nr:hypothetical protein [Candidatus Doudnabacteria bacterium]
MALGDNYLEKMKEKTGKAPKDFLPLAKAKGYDNSEVKPGIIIAWLKKDFGLGHGYAMALAHFIKTHSK